MVARNRSNYMDNGENLPKFMRDFHDAKALFKSIHMFLDISNNPIAKDVSWVTGQCYSIDVFLWFMGLHGYTLQKSHSKIDFLDLEKTLEECAQERTEQFRNILNGLSDV